VQSLLYKTGQIDRHGRVIDLEKNKSKIQILEREFARAELIEERRQKDEMEMRYRVQRKRFNELERMRKEEILHKLKHDRDLSKEIINTMRSSTSGSVAHGSGSIGIGMRDSMSRSQLGGSSAEYAREGFFITNDA